MTDRPFTLGGGIGFGGLSFRNANGQTSTDSAMSYTFRLGFGLRPGLLLLWDVEGAFVNKRDGSSVSQTANLAALQIFLGNRLFLKAGFGLAEVVQYDAVSNWGGAAMAGLGPRADPGLALVARHRGDGDQRALHVQHRQRDLDQLVARQLRDQLLLGP